METEKILEKESVFIIGRVFSVDGRAVKIRVDKNKNHSHVIYDGKTIKNVSVGSYVKILKGFTTIIGKIEGEYIEEERYFNREYKKEETKIKRYLLASLFGHYEGDSFKQGIKEMPLIDNECYILDRKEFNDLHRFSKPSEKTIEIGSLTEEPSQKIKLSVNKLFASHIGIFGNTGSGKSNTLARLYCGLFSQGKDFTSFDSNSQFVFIDFNGEYVNEDVLTKEKEVYKLTTRVDDGPKYPISQHYIEDIEILSVLLEATEKTQKPFLNRALNGGFLADTDSYKQSIENTIRTVIKKGEKTIGIAVIKDLLKDLASFTSTNLDELNREIENNLNQHTQNGNFIWGSGDDREYSDKSDLYADHFNAAIDSIVFNEDLVSQIQLKIILTFHHEIAHGYSNQEHIKPLVGRMFKKFSALDKVIEIKTPTPSHNVCVVSLRDVNMEMKKVLPLIICKQLYDDKKTQNGKKSLHIIIDEAHNILSEASERENDTWKDYRLETFEEIIKEGRKFATFLTIASQRPYDISPTIVSQLHNYFIHRLINSNDINAIQKTVAYLDKLSFDSIPILSVGSCFVAGLATDIPIKIDVELLPHDQQPDSETITLEKEWNAEQE
jgi:hypothetical protein